MLCFEDRTGVLEEIHPTFVVRPKSAYQLKITFHE